MQVVRQSVLRQTAQAWIRRHTAEAQLQHIAALYDENRLFDAAVRARLAGGRGMTSDVVLPREEAAQIAEREDQFNARRTQAIAALRRWIGDAAEWPLTGAPPKWPIDHASLAHRLEQHPELALYSHEARVLDAEVDVAKVNQWRSRTTRPRALSASNQKKHARIRVFRHLPNQRHRLDLRPHGLTRTQL